MGANFSKVYGASLDDLKTRCGLACDNNAKCKYGALYYGAYGTCYLHDENCGDYENNKHGQYHMYFKAQSAIVTPAPFSTPAPVAKIETPAPVAKIDTPAPVAKISTPAPVAKCPVQLVSAQKFVTTVKATNKKKIKGKDVDALSCDCETMCKKDAKYTFWYLSKIKRGKQGNCSCLEGDFKSLKKNKKTVKGAAGGLTEDARKVVTEAMGAGRRRRRGRRGRGRRRN